MISYHIKGAVIVLLCFIVKFLPRTAKVRKIERFLYIKRLIRIDDAAAGVEIARDMGVKVGKDCRFYGPIFGPEPFLIEIGNNVLISGSVAFITHDGGIGIFRKEIDNIVGHYGKIKIGDNCFLGYGSIILPNVQLGNNCIVAAGSVVMDSFPDDSIIMGNPAKLVFKTSLYKKMKLASKYTLTNDDCSFPEFNYLPYDVRKSFILERIGHMPIRRPRKHGTQ